MQVMPEYTRCQMAHGVEVIVGHHLGFARGSAGEVHQHRIVVAVHEGGLHELRCLLPLTLPVVEALRDGLAMICYGDILLHCRTILHRSLNLAHHIGIVYTDDSFHRGAGVTIDDIFLG